MSPFSHAAALGVLATLSAALLWPDDAAARPRRHWSHHTARAVSPVSTIYPDEKSCVAKKALDAAQCHNAALNSHAEYEEKAPRFEADSAARRCSARIIAACALAAGRRALASSPLTRVSRSHPRRGARRCCHPRHRRQGRDGRICAASGLAPRHGSGRFAWRSRASSMAERACFWPRFKRASLSRCADGRDTARRG